MPAKYIYRMDDIAPGMNWDWFWRYINLFSEHQVKPILGIVPDNKDPILCCGGKRQDFWQVMRDLQCDGVVEFAQHGYRHLYVTNKEGILKKKYGFRPQSEFVGLPYDEQYRKVKAGQDILKREGIFTDVWMAPSNSFDAVTLKVLVDLGFNAVTDGIALYPFKLGGLTLIPQQCWTPTHFFFGIATVSLHTNHSDEQLYKRVEKHLKSKARFICFSEARGCETRMPVSAINSLFRVYFLFRRYLNIRGRSRKIVDFLRRVKKTAGGSI